MCHIRPLRGLGFSPKIRYPPSPNGDTPFLWKEAINCGEAATFPLSEANTTLLHNQPPSGGPNLRRQARPFFTHGASRHHNPRRQGRRQT